MATVKTGACNANQPRALHAGLICELMRLSLSVSNSVGDVVQFGKLPHGAIPIDAVFYPGSAIAQTVAKFGTSASQELFFASATYSVAVARTTRPLGTAKQISLSDDFMPRYEHVVAVLTAAASVGFIGELAVFYRMPGQTY
jgi:hypothetical protein